MLPLALLVTSTRVQRWSFATDLENHRVGPGLPTGAHQQPELSLAVTMAQYQPSWVLPLGSCFQTTPPSSFRGDNKAGGSATVPQKSRDKLKAQDNHRILPLLSAVSAQSLVRPLLTADGALQPERREATTTKAQITW